MIKTHKTFVKIANTKYKVLSLQPKNIYKWKQPLIVFTQLTQVRF